MSAQSFHFQQVYSADVILLSVVRPVIYINTATHLLGNRNNNTDTEMTTVAKYSTVFRNCQAGSTFHFCVTLLFQVCCGGGPLPTGGVHGVGTFWVRKQGELPKKSNIMALVEIVHDLFELTTWC